MPAVRLYLSSMGGGHTFLFWLAFTAFLGCCELLSVVLTYWLGYWAQQYEIHEQDDVSVT